MKTIAANIRQKKLSVFDPMAGQAHAISSLTWLGHDVWLNDYNPALILLAWLRSRAVLNDLEILLHRYLDWLSGVELPSFDSGTNRDTAIEFHQGWIAPHVQDGLFEYANQLDGRSIGELFQDESNCRDELFKWASVVLAARRLVTYSKSDNTTWLKPGGLIRHTDIKKEIIQELEKLATWRREKTDRFGSSVFSSSESIASFSVSEAKNLKIDFARNADVVVCSPPYANRLDYSAMWAPELKVFEMLSDDSIFQQVKEAQIASTVTKGRQFHESDLDAIATDVSRSLKEIRDSKEYASIGYYYPYFANFCLDLHKSILSAAAASASAKMWLVFIRDTTRKDTLVESHRVVEFALEQAGFRRTDDTEFDIVRSHIGVARKGYAKQTLHGLAQREWSLIFTSVGGKHAG
ncbi:hypothetical protein [Thalassovita gelatinovora]|nr:hypothetical protein [Thalassovita gelatinovora]QIZ79088.1 hypothetical protein HFZ77_00655 [Thalassovita gelatinovora]